MTRLTPLRLIGVSFLTVVALGLAGLGWTLVRFGINSSGTAVRVEQHVRQAVSRQVEAVVALARRSAADPSLIEAAIASRDELPRLFEHLASLTAAPAGGVVATTLYVPTTPRGFRVLAWTDGPGDQALSDDRLAGPAAVFVAPGHAGLRLIAVEPVIVSGRTVAVAAAETILEPAERAASESERRMSTPYGPVTVISHYASTRDATTPDGFIIPTDSGTPLIEVRIDREALAAHRTAFVRRLAALVLVPLPIGLAMAAMSHATRQRRNLQGHAGGQRATRAGAVAVVAGLLAVIARFGGAPSVLVQTIGAVALLVLVIQLPGAAWWLVRARCRRVTPIARFATEQVAGGLLVAALLEVVAYLLDRWMTLTVLDRGPFVLFPFSAADVTSTGNLLLLETAAAWTAAPALALLAIRWRLVPIGPRTLAAVALWLAPSVGLLFLSSSLAGAIGPVILIPSAAAAGFALVSPGLRRAYGRQTQSARLGLALLAGFAPLVALYPLAAVTADRATREVIAREYAPATAGHPQELRAELERAQRQVDAMPGLAQLVSGMPSDDSQAAYLVWSRTGLQRSRVISDVELYGADRTLVSRFAFNLPEYVYRRTLQSWQGSSCTWDEQGVFGEVTPFGAEERLMLHAERGVCDAAGRLLGGIVLHVASNDYQAMPFISSPSPYYDALSVTDAGPRLPDLTLAVYGWSSQPIFTSGRAGWSVAPETFDRLYLTGEPFWTSLSADGRTYHVHFSQNRAGIYALGYPTVTAIEHATRLAEIAALVAVFFVVWQLAMLVFTLPAGRPEAPLRHLFHEVRTSFYRKLFISFVVVAVLPVLAAAVAFGGYMSARFRADVEFEASSTVAVAQRVFQELTAAGARPVELQSEPSDDVMVWIRQVIDEDVNLFDGPQLLATSQSDLFDSGILPMRTPAAVYRGIALERRPSMVAEDHLGTFQYLVAAAPVSAGRRDAVLTVSLAPRQREMERELDTLNRRVLVGAVLVVLFGAGVGASLATRISDPVARLTHATRQIAAGRLDVRVATDTADELRRLVEDFNSMAQTLGAQREELARANQLKAWNEMARQVAHEIKNPLTPVQLAAEHLQHVHEDRGRPLGAVLDRCVATVLTQVRLLRQIASEFANFAGEPTRRPASVDVAPLVTGIVDPYRVGLGDRIRFVVDMPADLPAVWADRTLVSRALTNLVENAVQAMPQGGTLRIVGARAEGRVRIDVIDTGVGMDALALEHAFEPYFSTKTGGSGLGLANARRNVEREGGTVDIVSAPGAGTTVTVTLPLAAASPAAP